MTAEQVQVIDDILTEELHLSVELDLKYRELLVGAIIGYSLNGSPADHAYLRSGLDPGPIVARNDLSRMIHQPVASANHGASLASPVKTSSVFRCG